MLVIPFERQSLYSYHLNNINNQILHKEAGRKSSGLNYANCQTAILHINT